MLNFRTEKKQPLVRSLLFALLLSAPLAVSAQVEINEENFPDENFRNYLLTRDYGKDGVLIEEEIEEVTDIDIRSQRISSLKGIEHFTALTQLDCSGNQLTALDVSKNTALENLFCDDNLLTMLDVTKNTALETLFCYNNQLMALDVSNNTALGVLQCSGNQLTALDVTKNTALVWLGCSGNQLTALDVSKNTALVWLNCYSNQLTALDVSKNTALTELWCHNNQLTALDVSNNTALIYMSCNDNQLTALDVTKNTALVWLNCYSNQLTALDVSKNTALTELWCHNNQLTALDVSNNTALRVLCCYSNQIKGASMDALIASLNTTEEEHYLYVYNSTVDDGNVCTKTQVADARAKGWILYDSEMKVYEGVDEGGEDKTSGIDINETNFPDENFRNYLLQSYGKDGVITEEKIKKITSMSPLGKNISSLKGIEHFTALTYLDCHNNLLTALDVSECTALTHLYCSKNQLTALDVSKNTALTSLSCSNNQLTALDVSGCTALTSLQCYNNQLTALDVSGCTALTSLQCFSNQIKGASMDALIASLPKNTTEEKHYLYVYNSTVDDGNICTKTQVAAAKAKGWTPYWRNDEGWQEYEGSDDEATAITRPAAEIIDVNTPVYTLSGQKVTGSLKDKKGVYIIGGKKVVVK